MRRFGLADGIGLVAALTAVAFLPGQADPLTYPKLFFLAAGGLALAPFVVHRWKSQSRPTWPTLTLAISAAGLLLWGVISMIATGAPIAVSLFGWWGRGDGWLALMGAVILALGAMTLNWAEVARTITWMLGGAAVVALISLGQLAGIDPVGGVGGQVTGTQGNINFTAAYFAMMTLLALGRVLLPASLWQRIGAGAIAVVLGGLTLTVLNDSLQGPASLGAGLVAFFVVAMLVNRGRFRVPGLMVAGGVVALGVILLALSIGRVGPLSVLWSQRTFVIRQAYWEAGWNMLNGLPIFGSGPDGFARYVAEYRTDFYVETVGPVIRVSAAHNIAIQMGATMGWIALILWVIAFVGAGIYLLTRVVRAPVRHWALTGSVAAAFIAYFTQGMVSIDMLPLLATGWTLLGLTVALAREPKPEPPREEPEPSSRKAKVAAAVAKSRTTQQSSVPVLASVTGGVLALVGAIAVGAQMGAANAVQSVDSQEAALSFISNPLTPCPLRVNVTQQVIQQLPADISVPATYEATALDPRCAPMINFQSDVAVQQGQLDVAGPSTLDGVTFDPLLDYAWLLRARYFLQSGDVAAAREAADQAERVQTLYPDSADVAALEALRAELESTP